MLDDQLPPRQSAVLHFYAKRELAGRPATRQEVADELGYAFASAVTKHVYPLHKKGYLVNDPNIKRNVSLTDKGWAYVGAVPEQRGIPVIGSIAAGIPISALENHSHYLEDLKPMAGRIALAVRGDSMVDAGISDGDYAIIDTQAEVRSGRIAAVVVDEEATLKVVRRKGRSLVLEPRNDAYEPLSIPPSEAERVRMVGPLVSVYRPFAS